MPLRDVLVGGCLPGCLPGWGAHCGLGTRKQEACLHSVATATSITSQVYSLLAGILIRLALRASLFVLHRSVAALPVV